MLLTVLRRWSWCDSLFGICGFYFGAFCAVVPCSLFPCCCFSALFSIVITSLGEERAGLCASCAFVCLFCTHQLLSFFSFSWCQELTAACDCAIPWTFLLIFFRIMNILISYKFQLLQVTPNLPNMKLSQAFQGSTEARGARKQGHQIQ